MKRSSFRLPTFLLFVCYFFSLTAAAQQTGLLAKKDASSGIEQAILDEINQARANPQSFIPDLENHRKLFKSNTIHYADGKMMTTVEGAAVVDEAIAYLKTLSKLPAYTPSKGLSAAANAQLADLMENSALGHYGKDGSNLPDRLRRFGSFNQLTAENITYFASRARQIVVTMIIDDGVKSRGHRKNIFSANFKQIGAAYGPGGKGEYLCVVIFADSFREAGMIPTDKRLKPF